MAKKIIIKKPIEEIPERYKNELNEGQFNAVTHSEGPALIIAGAGSGKTRALTYRVAYLIDNNVPPQSIILVTFTKKAAREMVARVEKLSGNKAKGINAGTFHHIANVVLHRYAKIVGLQNNFSILDEHDRIVLMKMARTKHVNKEENKRYPNASLLVEMHSKRVNLALTFKNTIEYYYPEFSEDLDIIERILNDYDTMKRQNNTLDYDDLLLYFLAYLQHPDSVIYKKKIRHVLVDEYQDLNAIQSKIVDELAVGAKTLSVVGDDAQAIYRFRGADFTHMLDFPKNNLGCIQYKLEENYRSTPEILNLANASIKHNKHQFTKTLFTTRPSGERPILCSCDDPDQEANLICQLILDHREEGIPLHEQAVLFRARFHSMYLERELVRRNIPYEVRAGVRFFEQAHIKDFLSMLIVITNPSDTIQWMRLISFHKGISAVSAQKIIDGFTSELNQLEQFLRTDYSISLKGKRVNKEGIASIKRLQNQYKKTIMDKEQKILLPLEQFPPLSELAQIFIKYLEPIIKENYTKDADDRVKDLHELVNFIAPYKSINTFLEDVLTQYELTGKTTKAGAPDEENPLVLSTIHQAKGLEWKVVFLMCLIEGQMPNAKNINDPDELEEERRLFYVACTRAKDYLILTYPRFFPGNYRQDVIEGPSRFITEIEDEEVFEEFQVEEEF